MSTINFPKMYAETRRFTTGTPRNFKPTDDGSTVFFLRSQGPTDPVLCLWALDTLTGTERIIVDPAALDVGESDLPAAELARRERARESANGIVGFDLAPDSSKACFALSGALAIADVESSQLTLPNLAGSVFDPRFSPDGLSIAYVSDGQLHVYSLLEDSDTILAADESETVSWGAAEFVAAEEMGRTRGYWWLPNSTSLLATRVDTAPVDTWWIADPAHPELPASENRYPAAGTNNAEVQLWLLHTDDSQAIQIDWSGNSTFEYLTDVMASRDSAPLVVRQTRDQRTVSVASIGFKTGSVTQIHQITDDVWVELIPGSPTVHSSGLLTIEDLTPLDHRALCRDGEAITGPELQVRAIVGVHANTVTFTASPDPTEIHVYEMDLETTVVRAVTTEPGVHSGVISESTLVVSSATSTTVGTQTTVGDHAIGNLSADAAMPAAPTFMKVGPRSLSTAVFVPSDHDGTTPLPVLLDPYGGPHAQRVVKTHNPHLVSRWFAEQGFVVIVTDGRGTPGRGPQFEREVWGDLAAPVLEDQIDALDGVAAELGFCDLGRVGIRGWSFGGYLAALAVLRRPDRVRCAIAGAPVTKWELYDTHYTERYLGHPAEYPHHYDQTNLLLEADKLTRPLLLIHGLADDNVVAAHTLQFSTELLLARRSHQVLPLSGVTHMTPQVAVAENLLHLQLDFLQDCLR